MRDAYSAGMMRPAIIPQRFLTTRDDPYVAFAAMPVLSDAHGLFVTKIGTVVSGAPGKPTTESLVVAFSTKTGAPLGVLDGVGVTNLKCAAVSAMVTDICAAPQARVLAIIGSGAQAREQIRGVGAVRQFDQIRVYSRDPRNVRSFIRACAGLARCAEFVACSSASEAVDAALVFFNRQGARANPYADRATFRIVYREDEPAAAVRVSWVPKIAGRLARFHPHLLKFIRSIELKLDHFRFERLLSEPTGDF